MKAIIYEKYGSQEVLQIKEIKRPVPKSNEILIKVHATTVNRTDCANLTAKPFIMRFANGLFKPKRPVPGTDFAGVIETIGADVQSLKAGDKVFGFDDGGLSSQAEYLVIEENKATIMPQGISFEQAAASLEGVHYAYNFINKVQLKKEHKVLVNGATGAIGSATVQLVKYFGPHVTAVCGTKHIERVKELGADRIIDYLKEDFTKDSTHYDFVFDSVGKSSFGKCKSILKSGGIYISSELGKMSQNLFFAILKPLMGSKKVLFPLPLNIKRSVLFISKLIKEGKFKPLIDRTYALNETTEAYRYVLTGEKIGNVIIKISE